MSPPRVRFPIGISDFRKLREGGFHYVDKTALIDDVLTESAEVMLAPRPRRFGKTLNLSMLRYFFEKSAEDRRPLFAGLAVASTESTWAHFQRYPVIFLTFKDIKPTTWAACFERIAGVLSELYVEHRYLLEPGVLEANEVDLFTSILDRRASESVCAEALRLLSRLLARHHREKVVILIDEYDSPIHAGYTNKYYDDVVAFFRDFLSGGLKDNADLFKGVLTGILRVAKESLFSGLNNYGRCDILVLPRTAGEPGVVLELKSVDTEAGETKEKAFTAAFRQIRERDYATELRERGASPIHLMAAAFAGKRAFVRAAPKKATAKKAPAIKRKGSRSRP